MKMFHIKTLDILKSILLIFSESVLRNWLCPYIKKKIKSYTSCIKYFLNYFWIFELWKFGGHLKKWHSKVLIKSERRASILKINPRDFGIEISTLKFEYVF